MQCLYSVDNNIHSNNNGDDDNDKSDCGGGDGDVNTTLPWEFREQEAVREKAIVIRISQLVRDRHIPFQPCGSTRQMCMYNQPYDVIGSTRQTCMYNQPYDVITMNDRNVSRHRMTKDALNVDKTNSLRRLSFIQRKRQH